MFPLFDNIPHRRVPWVTLLIIATNIGVMFWLHRLPEMQRGQVIAQRGFIPHRIHQLSDPKLVIQVNLTPEQERNPRIVQLEPVHRQVYGSVLTMMFLHGGWLHLLGNMWFLWVFGNNIEDRLGHLVFPLFYLLGGIGAAAVHWAIAPESDVPVIGASGAVAAVLGAYALTYPMAKVRTLIFLVVLVRIVDLPAMVVLGLWFVLQTVQGVVELGPDGGAGVEWWAYVGGFVVGLVLMPLLALGAPPSDTDWREEADRMFDLPGTGQER